MNPDYAEIIGIVTLHSKVNKTASELVRVLLKAKSCKVIKLPNGNYSIKYTGKILDNINNLGIDIVLRKPSELIVSYQGNLIMDLNYAQQSLIGYPFPVCSTRFDVNATTTLNFLLRDQLNEPKSEISSNVTLLDRLPNVMRFAIMEYLPLEFRTLASKSLKVDERYLRALANVRGINNEMIDRIRRYRSFYVSPAARDMWENLKTKEKFTLRVDTTNPYVTYTLHVQDKIEVITHRLYLQLVHAIVNDCMGYFLISIPRILTKHRNRLKITFQTHELNSSTNGY